MCLLLLNIALLLHSMRGAPGYGLLSPKTSALQAELCLGLCSLKSGFQSSREVSPLLLRDTEAPDSYSKPLEPGRVFLTNPQVTLVA